MSQQPRCPNLNHGRSNASVKFCPMCGQLLNPANYSRCDEIFHAAQKKSRNSFCYKCGKKL